MRNKKPYDKLAFIYKRLMDHVDYPKWHLYIKSFFPLADIPVSSILDLSCGTGDLLYCFFDSPYKIYGCDYSPSMVYQAKKSNNLPFFINNGCDIALKDNTIDVILFLYDSMNYLLNRSRVDMLVNEVKRVLTPGGLFIFDIVTDHHCQTYYRDFYESEIWADSGYYRHSYYQSEQSLQINDFQILIDGKKYLERHRQKIYSLKQMKNIVENSKLTLVKVAENYSMTTATEKSGRVHFICKKNRVNS